MFDIGFSELLIIALVGLIVLGPKRLPEVARTAGRWLSKLRRFMSDVKQDIDREMQHAELAELRNLKQELDETRRVMEETSGRLMQEANVIAAEGGESASPPPAAASLRPPDAPPPPPATPPSEPPVAPAAKKRSGKRRKKAAVPKQEHDRAE